MQEFEARGCAKGTIDRARGVLEDWGAWMKRSRPRPQLEHVDAQLITRYFEARKSFRAKTTVYGVMSVMRGMGDYLVRESVWSVNPLRWMKGPKITPYARLPKRLNESEMERMWDAAAATRSEYWRHLWLCALALLYSTGIRRGELSRLNVEHWNGDELTLRIDGRKNGRERIVPVPELVARCLQSYLPQRQNHLARLGLFGVEALLLGADGERLNEVRVSKGVHRIADRAGVRLHSVHQFRHSCASDLLASGVGLAHVQRVLGHQAICTTVRYAHVADPMRVQAIAQHPINDWLRLEGKAA